MEDTFRESEAPYQLIAEHVRDLIALLDQEGRYRYASPSHLPLLGYDPTTLIGSTILDLVHPVDRAPSFEQWLLILTSGATPASFRYRRADGSWRWIEAQGTVFQQQGTSYIVTVMRDITERKDLEAQLLQAQKLDCVGRLAGGIAHDFNNLLTGISGYAELVLLSLPPDSPARSDLKEIRRAAAHAANLTDRLLAFARKQIIAPQILNLNDRILDMEKLLRRLIGEDIELVILLSPDLGVIRADPGQIEQLLLNLIINARDAMPQGGCLLVETASVLLDEGYAREHTALTSGPSVLLSVSDTGTGMDSETLAHIFEPFFTTKEPGKGTGLGLAICYEIIRQHGGTIQVDSQPGQGTTFKMYLPCVITNVAESPNTQEPAMADLPRGSETVLLVEDEPSVLALAARLLCAQGYTVLTASNGDEALRIAQEHTGTIHLLLTDMVLPRLGGKVLAERLAELFPRLKVVFASGYTDLIAVLNGRLDRDVTFLQKPFSRASLAHTVREMLDS